MNKVKLYILPLFLLLSSLIAGVMIVKSLKDITSMESSAAAVNYQPVVAPTATTRALSPQELLTAKNVFAAMAVSKELPIDVTISANRVVAIAEKNSGILQNYDGIIAYLTGISDLPYAMKYESFCVGRDCPKDFVIDIALRK